MGDKPGPSSRSIYFNPSKSQVNYFRLCGLITTICSDLLKVVVGHYIKPAELRVKLDANRLKLEQLMNTEQKKISITLLEIDHCLLKTLIFLYFT